MPSPRSVRIALAAVLALGCAPALADVPEGPGGLPEEGPVQVRWTDPQEFGELRHSGNRWEASRGEWLQQLAEYTRRRAEKRLPPEHALEVTFTDIERAGSYEPWHGPRADDIRIVRDIYPPRIELTYTLTGPGGAVVDRGEEELRDMGFLQSDSTAGASDPLRYEKQMLDRWLRELLPDA